MDCERFDQHVIDALYGELDELTQAGLERHVEGCSRCGPTYAGLRATRAVAVLPLDAPPEDLEARIMAAADLQIGAPWRRKGTRAVGWAGPLAARPQIAAAAVFFLVVGSSIFLFRSTSMRPERAAAPAAAAAETAAAPETPTPAATAEAQVPPRIAAPDPELARKVASGRSADAGASGGDSPALEASAAPADVAAVPSAAAARAVAGRAKAVEAPAAAAQRAPVAKPAAPSQGGTNPRAPAAPKSFDAAH